MPQHIGIVACSAEGAALCYRTICTEGPRLLGPHAHPEVSMHTPSLAATMACIYRGDLQGVGFGWGCSVYPVRCGQERGYGNQK